MKMIALKSMTPKAKERRKAVIASFEKQLQEGAKPNKSGINEIGITKTKHRKDFPRIPLTIKDIERINKEIALLKTRI